jgi:hypothetical protein
LRTHIDEIRNALACLSGGTESSAISFENKWAKRSRYAIGRPCTKIGFAGIFSIRLLRHVATRTLATIAGPPHETGSVPVPLLCGRSA